LAQYDAFISYSHAKDKPVAAALQTVVQTLGKPWYRRRALRIFRDDTSLSATPGLWPSIEQALAQSRFLVFLASPESAASQWVSKEVAYWLEHRGADTLLIALTDGDLSWDNVAGDFRSAGAPALPQALKGRFAAEPKWVDLRSYRDRPDPRDGKFIEAGADFAAAIHGIPKEDLLSQELRQQRRALSLAWSAAGVLLLLAGAAVWQWQEALAAQRLAQEQRDRAERTLAAATETANTFILDMAQELRNRQGMPVDLTRKILDRARGLQRQLAESGEVAPDLLRSEAMGLTELALTLNLQGDNKAALESAERAREIMSALLVRRPNEPHWWHDHGVNYLRIGDIKLAAGARGEAMDSYREGVTIFERLAGDDPTTVLWQRSLIAGQNKIAFVLEVAGRAEEALALDNKSLVVIEKLAAAKPNDRSLQRDLAVQHNQIGDLLLNLGRREEALEAYRRNVAIAERLASLDPNNTEWQRDLSVSADKVGNVLLAMGNTGQALEAFRLGLTIRSRLAAADRGNTKWQRDLSLSHDRVGDVLLALGRTADALESYRASLAIAETLAAADPRNADWQRDLSVSAGKLGNVLAKIGRRDEALASHRRALAIAEKLAAMDPGNTDWQRDLAVSYSKVGDMLEAAGRHEEALAAYRSDLAVSEKLVAADPRNTEWQRDLSVSYERLGRVLFETGRRGDAVDAFGKARAIRERLAAADPGNAQWQSDLVISLMQSAGLGDNPRANLNRALEILRRLEREGGLSADQKRWMDLIVRELAKLPRQG
jgi:tetratricopeptide (TPR) repeat protein